MALILNYNNYKSNTIIDATIKAKRSKTDILNQIKSSKKILVSYAQNCCIKSSKRLCDKALDPNQANFTECLIFNESFIKQHDYEFYTKNLNIFNLSRGAGYWLWKPYIINKMLSSNIFNFSLSDHDYVIYMDTDAYVMNNIDGMFEL